MSARVLGNELSLRPPLWRAAVNAMTFDHKTPQLESTRRVVTIGLRSSTGCRGQLHTAQGVDMHRVSDERSTKMPDQPTRPIIQCRPRAAVDLTSTTTTLQTPSKEKVHTEKKTSERRRRRPKKRKTRLRPTFPKVIRFRFR